jgi:uncharacterized membrane protein
VLGHPAERRTFLDCRVVPFLLSCWPVTTRAVIRQFLYKERRWWLPLRILGWAYAYWIIAACSVIAVLITLAVLAELIG